MPNLWIEALKKWNAGKGMWCLPRKGTKDYDEVRALMSGKAAPAKKETLAPSTKEDEMARIMETIRKGREKKGEKTLGDALEELGYKAPSDKEIQEYKAEGRSDAAVRKRLMEKYPHYDFPKKGFKKAALKKAEELVAKAKEAPPKDEMVKATPPAPRRVIKLKKAPEEAPKPAPKEDKKEDMSKGMALAFEKAEKAAEEWRDKTKSKSAAYIKRGMARVRKRVYEAEKKKYEEKVRAIIAQRANK